MSIFMSVADGGLTGGSTYALADNATGATNLLRNSSAGFSGAGTFTSGTFSTTNGKIYDGVMLWLRCDVTNPTGTFKIDIQKGGVSQASVTVNKTDLPQYTGTGGDQFLSPWFFKFTSTATGDGGSNWTYVITTTGTGSITYKYSSASNMPTRALRTTTTGTPGAGDDILNLGEVTGAGTFNARSITIDSTTNTQYGNGTKNTTSVSGGLFVVGCHCTVAYGTSVSTNYYFRLAGDVYVGEGGVFSCGSNGAEIPRSSTAVFEFAPTNNMDFGFYCTGSGLINGFGLSRTSGKNVFRCKLTADVGVSLTPSILPSNNVVTTNATDTSANIPDLTGSGLFARVMTDNTTNGYHSVGFSGSPNVTNVMQTAYVELERGTGATNRYARVTLGNGNNFASTSNGCYVDVDMQLGTVGTPTAIGNGTATSASIVASGNGWIVKLIGKVSTGLSQPNIVINACSAAGTLQYAGNTTQCFRYRVTLLTASSIPDTTWNVDRDTGWLNGDIVVPADTARRSTYGGMLYDALALNANAGASSFTTAQFSPLQHDGSGNVDIVADVILLTRNVVFRTTDMTKHAFMKIEHCASLNLSWVQFKSFGDSGTSPSYHCLDIQTVNTNVAQGLKNIQYCSFMESQGCACYVEAGGGPCGVTFSNNVIFRMQSGAFYMNTNNASDYVCDNNVCIGMNSGNVCFTLGNSLGGVFTNNTACAGGTGSAFGMQFTSGKTIGTISGNTVYAFAGAGIVLNGGAFGLMDTFTALRCASFGMQVQSVNNFQDNIFSNLKLIGNAQGISSMPVVWKLIGNSVVCSDTTYTQTPGMQTNQSRMEFDVVGLDMSGTGTGRAANGTGDIQFVGSSIYVTGTLNYCKFSTIPFVNKAIWSKDSYIGMEKYGQVAGDHRCEFPFGQMRTDTSIYRTAFPSSRITPSSATSKVQSAPKGRCIRKKATNGNVTSIAKWVRKAAGSDLQGAGSFNPSDLTANIALSNGNLTATTTSNAVQQAVRSNTSRSTGKWMISFVVGATATGGGGYGFTRSSDSITGLSGNTSGFSIAATNGNILHYGANSGKTVGAIVAGDVLDIAIDLVNYLGWVRRNGGNWNGDITADPATGVGGINISSGFSGGTAVFFYFAPSGTNSASVTANVGNSTFTYAVPSGFGAWDTGSAYNGSQPRLFVRANVALGLTSDTLIATASGGAGTWEQLSGNTPIANDDGTWEFYIDGDGTFGWLNIDDAA